MQAKSFLGNMREQVRHFYATSIHGEVSDANIRGYLRAASQIEDIWQQIDEKLAALNAEGKMPWEAYAQLRYALAFIRAARACQVFVKELLAADAASDPQTAGFLPQVTYDQADALCHQIPPDLERPVAHLQGMIAAAREIREWAAGLIAQYELAVRHVDGPVPAEISSHIAALQGRLSQADSQLRFGVDLVGQISQGEATPQLHEEAENSLWEAMQNFFLINQAVAMPEALQARQMGTSGVGAGVSRRTYRDRLIRPDDLWRVAAPSARSDIRGTKFGTDEMEEMCEKMGGILSAGAQQYLDEVDAAVARGDAYMIAAMANCPFEPLYRARRPLNLAGAQIPANYEFHWNFHRGHIESAQRFGRVSGWQECEE